MKLEKVEIYSDAPNMAVMKHPGRQYPGSLIQGDSLFSLTQSAKRSLSDFLPLITGIAIYSSAKVA